MSEYNIFRPLTPNEKAQGVQEITKKNLMNQFSKELAKMVSKYQAMYMPYDSYSARIDFEDRVRRKVEDFYAAIDKSTVDVSMDFGDLDSYANPANFELTDKQDIKEDKLLDGIRQKSKIAVRYTFKCKKRGNKLSIVVPWAKPSEDTKEVADAFEKADKWITDNFIMTPKAEPVVEKKAKKVE